uniref:OSJNBa0085H03.7 protein n=1 Tax=Oryza sativa subsp. japonica TaxID=39947 RepID=Q7XSG6_ORYSJ|nr:OSJNBa0085H03.7 [Oryza sativa Japonica Group]
MNSTILKAVQECYIVEVVNYSLQFHISYDVTMATMDATIAHIMDEQEDIEIKYSKCWNLIRPPTTLLTSNGHRICIRPPFSAREYLMESSRSLFPTDPASSPNSISCGRNHRHKRACRLDRPSACIRNPNLSCVFIPICNSDCFYLVLACFFDLLVGIRLICTGKINNPRRGVSIAKAQHNVFYLNSPKDRANNSLECRVELRVHQVVSELSLLGLCPRKRDGHAQRQHLHHQRDIATSSRITYEVHDNDLTRVESKLPGFDGQLFMLACNVERKILENPTEQQAMLVPPITDVLQEVQNSPQNEKNDMFEMSLPSLANEEKANAPTLSEEGIKGKLNGAEITQDEYASDELHFSTFHADLEQTLVEPTSELPLSQVDLHSVPCDKEELCDSTSLISIPQLVNEHATFNLDSPCTEFKYVIHTSSENDELQLQSSLNTLGYVMFDDSCELNCLKDKIFAHSD